MKWTREEREFVETSRAWPPTARRAGRGRSARVAARGAFRRVRARLYRKYSQYESIAPLDDRESVALEITPSRKVSWGF